MAELHQDLLRQQTEKIYEQNVTGVRKRLEEVPYIIQEIGRRSGDCEELGDYGNGVYPLRDFELNFVFMALGIVGQDQTLVTTDKIREWSGTDERQLNCYDKEGRINLRIFLPKSGNNFRCLLLGLTDENRRQVEEKFNEFEGHLFLKRLGQQLEKQDGGMVALPEDEFSLNYIEERLKEMGLVNGWRGFKTEKVVLEDGKEAVELKIDKNEAEGSNDGRSFLKSQTAGEILGILDYFGLELTNRLVTAFSEGEIIKGYFSQRNGNGFAELSRLTGALVGRQREELLFGENFEREKIEELKQYALKMEDGPVKQILLLMVGVVLRDDGSGFEYYATNLSLYGDGACKDSEVYLVEESKVGQVKDDENFVYFYGGRHGTGEYDLYAGMGMAMTRREMVVNGVLIPAGFFCRVSADRTKVEPIRISMFAFSEEQSRDAFGKQFDDFMKNGGNFGRGRRWVSK